MRLATDQPSICPAAGEPLSWQASRETGELLSTDAIDEWVFISNQVLSVWFCFCTLVSLLVQVGAMLMGVRVGQQRLTHER